MSKSLVIQEAWSQIDRSFDALRALIKHKSGGNAQAALAAIKVAQKSFGEASTLHQSALTNIKTQGEHRELVAQNRVLTSHLGPLIESFAECMQPPGERPRKPQGFTKQLLAAIEEQLRLVERQPSLYHKIDLSVLTTANLRLALDRAVQSDDAGVAIAIRLLRDLSRYRPDLAEAVKDSILVHGRLSDDTDTVEVRPGTSLSIGEMPTASARILLAARYLELSGELEL